MDRLIEFFTKQTLFGVLLAAFTILVGLAALSLIRREVFPNVKYDIISVVTIFPGASPEEVEQLIVNPIERNLKELDGIKRLQSYSVEGRGSVVIQLDPDQTTEAQAKSDLRDIIDRVKPDLPEGAEEPVINSIESKQQPIIEVAVYGELPDLELRDISKGIKEKIEDIEGVARVEPVGLRDIEIRVETSQRWLRRYQLSLEDVINALKKQNLSIPGGTLEVSKKNPGSPERIVRTTGQFKTLKDVQNTVIRANDLGRAIRVGDIATVVYDLQKAKVIDHVNGHRSIRLTVLKKEKADAIQMVDKVKALVDELRPNLDKRIQLEYVNDLSFLIKRRLRILSTNLMVGLVLVAGLLSLLLPLRVALIVSIGIPFSFLGTMILFNSWDYSINLISLIGLIIVSGMLVDDAIVVTDNCVQKMEEGLPPQQAAALGTKQIWIPVTASVMTSVVVFLPMLFMSGIFGKFVKQIPLGVIIALLISLIEAFFILPGHISKWARVKRPDENETKKRGLQTGLWDKRVLPTYMKIVSWSIRRRYWMATGAFLLVVGSITFAALGMRLILFPADDVEIFMIRAQAPTGSALAHTENLIRPVEKAVQKLPEAELKNFLTTIGMHFDGPEVRKRGSEYVQVTVYLTPPNTRERGDSEIIEELRKTVGQPKGFESLVFERVNPGPPVGKPVDIGIRAKEYEDILPAAEYVKKILKKTPGITDIEDDYVLGKEELRVRVRPAEASAARVSIAEIGNTVRASFEGLIATTVRTLDEEIDVRVSLSKSERTRNETLKGIRVPNIAQNLIPLSRISRIENTRGLAQYSHEDYERQVSVTASVDTSVTTARDTNAQLKELVPSIEKKFPKVRLSFGGEDKDTQESMASLGRAFIVALMGVFLILVLTFKNLLHPLLVFTTIPLGLVAIVWAFFIHGKPLTFMGMLGAVALSGVIVNNAIVFIDFVHQRREAGMENIESILDAARARLRPIFLTVMTTTVGLLPTTYGIGGLDRFVVYITMALSWGLFFGSILTSIFLPTAIAITDDMSRIYKDWLNRNRARPSEIAVADRPN